MIKNSIYYTTSGGDCPASYGDYYVDFVRDFDNQVTRVWVDSGEDAIPPATLTGHTYLSHGGYVGDYTNVTENRTVGVYSKPTDTNTYLFYYSNDATGLKPSVYITKDDTSLMTMTFDDGETATSSVSGNITLTKPTAWATDTELKVAKIECAGAYTIGDGGASSVTSYKSSLVACYMGNTAKLNSYAFYQNTALTNVVINADLEQLSNAQQCFNGCFSIQNVIIPNIASFSGGYMYQNAYALEYVITNATVNGFNTFDYYLCASLKYITVPSALTAIDYIAAATTRSITELEFPSTMLSIDQGGLQNMTGLKSVTFNATSVVTLANVNGLSGGVNSTRYYVPDSLVASYKVATNWVTYANQIYPLSEKF